MQVISNAEMPERFCGFMVFITFWRSCPKIRWHRTVGVCKILVMCVPERGYTYEGDFNSMINSYMCAIKLNIVRLKHVY